MDVFETIAWELAVMARELGKASACITCQVTGNVAYQIFPNKAMNQYPLRASGFSWAFDLKFTAAVAQFLGPWKAADVNALALALANTQLSYLGAAYKVVSVDIYAGGQMIEVTCNAVNQGA